MRIEKILLLRQESSCVQKRGHIEEKLFIFCFVHLPRLTSKKISGLRSTDYGKNTQFYISKRARASIWIGRHELLSETDASNWSGPDMCPLVQPEQTHFRSNILIRFLKRFPRFLNFSFASYHITLDHIG